MDALTLSAVEALGRALQDPHLDDANRAAIRGQIDQLATAPAVWCEAAAEWDHDWDADDRCRECGIGAG